MSYCRWGEDSDVYVIHHVYGGGWCCYANHEKFDTKGFEHLTKTREQMIDHLVVHKNNDDKVPENVFDRLRSEIEKQGDTKDD